MSLKSIYQNIEAEIAAVDAEAAPLIARGKELNAQIEKLRAEQRELADKLARLKDADYVAKRKLLGSVAVAMGGRHMTAESSATQRRDFRA